MTTTAFARLASAARSHRRGVLGLGAVALLIPALAACSSSGPAKTATSASYSPSASAAATASTPTTTGPPNIVSAPHLQIKTAGGQVAYREVGSGTPLVLIMGLSGSIDDWDPAFVDALAARYRVIVFNNAGIGGTAALPSPLSITAMAGQTSDFISALGLSRVDVLGWSMGGMIAQALAVLHPAQVSKLVLAATQPGTGHASPVPAAAAAAVVSGNPATVLSVLFPRSAATAEKAYAAGILSYQSPYQIPSGVLADQGTAVQSWLNGVESAGRQIGRIRMPTLVADGTEDALNPVANDRLLAKDIPGAQLALYPGAGHAFLFQDATAFVPRLEQVLG